MHGITVSTPLISAFLVEMAGGKPTYVAVFLGICCALSAFAVYKLMSMQAAKQAQSATSQPDVVEG